MTDGHLTVRSLWPFALLRKPLRSPPPLRVLASAMAVVVAVAVLLVTGAMPALALEPEQREVTVVTGRVWDGHAYAEVLLPSTHDGMAFFAGKDNAIVQVRTLEYYWPLSRKLYVDFERQRDVVEGDLTIRRDEQVIGREPLQPYAVLYPEGAARGPGTMLWGAEAEKAYADHQENERRFTRDFAAAQRAHAAYERALVQSGAARRRGEPFVTPEPPPPLPEPSLRMVTRPVPAYRVNLAPGLYRITIEREGRTVPGTYRRLQVIDLAGRDTLVADIIPSERWTRPLPANSSDARVYARPGAIFYMSLFQAHRFDEAEYLPVVRPQADPVAGRSMWIRRAPADVARLQVDWAGADGKSIPLDPLKVEQTAGTSFGYRVRLAEDGETSDLEAFTIAVPSDPSVTRGRIQTADGDTASLNRNVVIVQPRRDTLALAAAVLPLAGYLVLAGLRARTGSSRLPWSKPSRSNRAGSPY